MSGGGGGGIRALEVGLGLNTSAFTHGLSAAGSAMGSWATAQQAKLAQMNAAMLRFQKNAVQGRDALGRFTYKAKFDFDPSGFKILQSNIDGTGKTIEVFNAKVSKTPYIIAGAAKAAQGAGLLLAGAFAVGISKAMHFESSMAKIKALTIDAEKYMGMYTDGISKMSTEVGVGANELANSLYFVTSAGVTGAQAMEAVRLSAMGAKMGMGEAGQVARLLTATVNAFPNSGMTMEHSFDLLTQAIKYGTAEASEYAAVMGNVLSVAEASGQSLEQVYAAIATYTRTGQTAGQAVTAIRQALINIQAPSRIAADAFKMLAARGYDIKATLKEKGLHAALLQLHQAIGKNAEAYRVLFPSVEAMNVALALGGTQAQSYTEALEGMSRAAGEGAKGFKAIEETAEAQWAKMKVAVENMFKDIGKKALPSFQQLLPTIRDITVAILGVIKAFAGLPPTVQKWTFALLGVVAILPKLIAGFTALKTTLTLLGAAKGIGFIKEFALGLAVAGQRATAFATGTTSVKVGSEAALMTFGKVGASLQTIAYGFGAAALAAGVFYASYKGTQWITKELKDLTGIDLVKWGYELSGLGTIMRGFGAIQSREWERIGKSNYIDITKGWTSEELKLYEQHVANVKRLSAITKDEWAKRAEEARANVEKLKQIGFGLTGYTVESGFKPRLPGLGTPVLETPTRVPLMRPADQWAAGVGVGAAGAGGDIAALGGEAMTGPIALSRDMVKAWRKEAADATKTADEWKKTIAELGGTAAANEMAALSSAVSALEGAGGRVTNIKKLGEDVMKLVESSTAVQVPLNLMPAYLDAIARASKDADLGIDTTIKGVDALAPALKKAQEEWAEVEQAMEDIGPDIDKVTKKFAALQLALKARGGLGKLTNAELANYLAKLRELAATGLASQEQLGQLGDAQAAAWNRGLESMVDEAGETKNALDALRDKTKVWKDGLQGVVFVAGMIHSIFARTEGPMGELAEGAVQIADILSRVDWGAKNDKGGWLTTEKKQAIGQAGDILGGFLANWGLQDDPYLRSAGASRKYVLGRSLQTAGQGFMYGGPIGAAVGGLVGLFVGNKEKEEKRKQYHEDLKAMIKDLADSFGGYSEMIDTGTRYGVDLEAAFEKARKSGGKMEDVTAVVENLKKRIEGTKTAVEGLQEMFDNFSYTDAAGNIVSTFSDPTVATAAAQSFSVTFWALYQREGITALKNLRPQFDAMLKQLEDLGIDTSTLGLEPIQRMMNLADDPKVAALLGVSSGSAKLLTGSREAGFLDTKLLQAQTEIARATYRELVASGLSSEEATRAMATELAALHNAYEATGKELPEDLRKAMEEAGIEVLDDQLDVLKDIRDILGGGAPGRDTYGATYGKYAPPDDVGTGRREPYDVGFASGTKGPVVVKKDLIAKIHAGEGLMVIPREEMVSGGFAFGSFARGIWDDDFGGRDREREPETGPTVPTPTEVSDTITSAIENLLPQLQAAVAKAAPVTIAPNIQIDEDPEGDKESRTARRRSTVDAVADAFRRREPALIIEARRALENR